MTFEQSGINPRIDIHGNVHDVGRNQINVTVAVYDNGPPQPSLVASSINQACRRRTLDDAPDNTAQIIQDIACLVPIDVAKTILQHVAAILLLMQKHADNKVDLKAPIRYSKAICSTVALATKGASMDRPSVDRAYWKALGALQSSIDDLHSRVRHTLKRGRTWPLFIVSTAEGEISAWSTELDTISTSFSGSLNIVSVNTLEQIYELLQRPDVPNLIPDPPPLPPPMFFGREELLRTVKVALLCDKPITLIGPGGIGKSTLAMALMNEPDIIKHYRRRFFVTYASMNPKTVTFDSFVDCVANTLGLSTLGAKRDRQIETNLALSSVLLVLDNAETFEDAVDREGAARISSFVALIANTPGVTVMLTSRTNSNAKKVSWAQFSVPPLEREPARLSFREIYHEEISDDEIDRLLAVVDCHPLSISILAYAAKANVWTGQVLWDRWNLQQGEILQTGDGKDNLGFTVRLSLESPSVEALGKEALGVLWIISFFPQGLNEAHLASLFPSIQQSHVSLIRDTLCRLSLIYPCGGFITTLAPIRLYLLNAFSDADTELLGDIRQMYYRSLEAISDEKDPHADLLVSDHLNIENLIAFDMVRSQTDIGDIMSACYQFLRGLRYHKPRPTLLTPTITSLPATTDAEKHSKARYLGALGELYLELSNYSFAFTASSAAHELFVAVGDHTKAARCVSTTALSCYTRGNFSQAQELLETFIRSPSWHHVDKEGMAKVHYTLDVARMHLSSNSVDQLFSSSMDHSSRRLQSHVRHWQAKMHHGYATPEKVEELIEPLRSRCMSSRDVWDRWRFFEAMAEAAFLRRSFGTAVDLLDEARKSVHGSFRLSVNILICEAALASDQGDYSLSRSLSRRCIETLGVVATASSTKFLHLLYVQGRNELYAGSYSTAIQFLTDAVAQCDVCDEIRAKAFCTRALGEAEIHLGRETISNEYYVQTRELCEKSGIPPELLGVCNPMLKLDDDKFPGWKKFLTVQKGRGSDLSHTVRSVSMH